MNSPNMTVKANYYAETDHVKITRNFRIENIVRKNVIGTFDVGTIIISIGNVCDLIYLSVTTISVRFVRDSFDADTEEADLQDLQGWNAITSFHDRSLNS